ncbi:MAG: lipid-A-disaccharide synthase [bacterium]|nr:lipid-A-disaccharide synthase [bacterium]
MADLTKNLELTIAIIAVEPSADLHGGNLVRALRVLNPNIKFVGIGGSCMAQANVHLWMRTTDMAIIGFGEALLHLHEYIYHYLIIRSKLLGIHPDLTILIDCPAINIRYAGLLRRYGYRSVYYFPPSTWTTSETRLRQIFGRTDLVICTFLSNAKNYRRYGMEVEFFGHPLADIPELKISREEARTQLDVSGSVLAILPGSRAPEIKYLLPIFLETADKLHDEIPGLQVLIPCATHNLYERIKEFTGHSRSYIRLLAGQARLALIACDAALMSSGTASLEAAILGAPMVLSYKLCTLDAVVCRLLMRFGFLKIDHIGLPSLVANRRVVPEFIQEEVTSANILPHLRNFLQDTPERSLVKKELAAIRDSVGEPGVVDKIAARVYEMACEKYREPVDIFITSNSPGEIASWVKHTARELNKLRKVSNRDIRIIVALVPCPYASGAEAEVAARLEGIDIVLRPLETVSFMMGLWGSFKPSQHGVVVFLGGDLMHAKLLARSLHYPSVAYAVRPSKLLRSFDHIAVCDSSLMEELQARGFTHMHLVGNLGIDGVASQVSQEAQKLKVSEQKCLGIFPGSRFLHAKASLAVFMRIAAMLKSKYPQLHFLLSVSPFISVARLKSALYNPFNLGLPTASGYLVSKNLIKVECSQEPKGSPGRQFEIEVLWGEPYRAMAKIDMALTIPGTNTGELACCGKPMVVALSADAALPRGGVGGLLERLPFIPYLKRYLRLRSYAHQVFAAIPNRLAQRQIVPEILVKKDIDVLTEPFLDWLAHPEKAEQIAGELVEIMGSPKDSSRRLAELIMNAII